MSHASKVVSVDGTVWSGWNVKDRVVVLALMLALDAVNLNLAKKSGFLSDCRAKMQGRDAILYAV